MFTLRYLLLCCLLATAFASDDGDGASTSPIVWVLFALLFLIVAAMMIAMLFIAYHFHQRFKKIEFKFSRRASVSSDRYTKSSDSRRSSKRSITSTGRYENNPIRKRRSRSPRNSPQPDAEQQQNHNSNDHVTIPMDTIHRNLQEPQQHPQIFYTPNNALGHYETLAMYANNGSVIEDEGKEEEEVQQQQQQQDETSAVDNQYNQQNIDSNDYENDDVPVVEASYITPLPDSRRTVTHTINEGDGQGLEYSDVVNPSPPTPNKNEPKKVNSVRKGKRPESSEEYTDPILNGVANMKRLKASSVSAEVNSSKERRASESTMGTPHRKDFEEWPIKAQGANTAPAHESDL